ncbi:hypothetical protein KIW84_063621 [Lathyrus oleraceus]|uniref:Uncharacterized protein n=1 Tax=Pisum sativum TaxID=3888 RepID=A0A9D4VFT8_PEA|nr:hypothetical protein KIW84_070471 [Pisum sativum]KAI5397876.1 hypothetical protein KIW84_063621 [Pisum sativum]
MRCLADITRQKLVKNSVLLCHFWKKGKNGTFSSHSVAEEVKALSDCISQVKKIIDHYGDSDGLAVPTSSVCQMQSLMLLIMGYVANVLMCNVTSAQVISEQVEGHCFVDAAIVSAKIPKTINIITE